MGLTPEPNPAVGSGAPDTPKGLALFDGILSRAAQTNPWAAGAYAPDVSVLEEILSIPVSRAATTQSGLYGKGLDAWFAQEFRRAGFATDSVWPRASEPRVVPQEITALVSILPKMVRADLVERLLSAKSVAPQDARIRGRAYVKQVDVGISAWTTGPELLLSTKSQSSSFGKNLPNRSEEAYGDAGNLRARHPLAAVGFAFVLRSTVLDEVSALPRAIDMMRKLRDRGDGNGYTATCLLVVDWNAHTTVSLREDLVPEDLGAGPFMDALIDVILANAPISEHVAVRYNRDALDLPD